MSEDLSTFQWDPIMNKQANLLRQEFPFHGCTFEKKIPFKPSETYLIQCKLWFALELFLNKIIDMSVEVFDTWTGTPFVSDTFHVKWEFFYVDCVLNFTSVPAKSEITVSEQVLHLLMYTHVREVMGYFVCTVQYTLHRSSIAEKNSLSWVELPWKTPIVSSSHKNKNN